MDLENGNKYLHWEFGVNSFKPKIRQQMLVTRMLFPSETEETQYVTNH